MLNLAEDDAALVRRSQEGELEAFHMLVTRHEGRVLRLTGQVLGSSATAQDLDDVALAVFAEAWRDLRSLRASDQFPAWLSRRTVHTALRRPPRRRPEPADTLPRLERAVVRLHFTGRYTASEIGYLLGRSVEDVWAMLYAGCRRLRSGETKAECTEPG